MNGNPFVNLFNYSLDWYRSPSANEMDYQTKQFMKSLPFIGGYYSSFDTRDRMNDYLRNQRLDYSNVRYNSAPFGTTLGSTIAQAPVTAMSLYRSYTRSAEK